jgi:hypothetical protein
MRNEIQADRVEQLRVSLQAESGDSLKLAIDIAHNPVCSITVDEEASCVVLIWKRYATRTQIRFVHEQTLKLMQERGLGRILGDDTRLPTIHVEDRKWIVEDWMPRAHASGLRLIASKTPAMHFGRVAIEDLRGAAPAEIVFRTFADLAAARRWLMSAGQVADGAA